MRIGLLILSTLILLSPGLGLSAEEKETISDLAKRFARNAGIVDMSLSPGGDYERTASLSR